MLKQFPIGISEKKKGLSGIKIQIIILKLLPALLEAHRQLEPLTSLCPAEQWSVLIRKGKSGNYFLF